MSKHFVRTADWHYINLDFVKSVYYKKHEYSSIDKDAELFEIILECVDGEVSFGFIDDEGDCLDIIHKITDEKHIVCDYFDEQEGIDMLKKRAKKVSSKMEHTD